MLDEIKPHLRANSTVLRSETPELVLQELWGLLLVHFAIRQLGALGDHRAITVVPRTVELTTTAAANSLSVSRPCFIKQLEAGRLTHRKAGTHRRIDYADLATFKQQMQAGQNESLQGLTDDVQDLGMK